MSVTLGAPTARPSRSPSPSTHRGADGATGSPRGDLPHLFPAGTSRRGRLVSWLLLAFTIGSVCLFLAGAPIRLGPLSSPPAAGDVPAPAVLRREDATTAASLTDRLEAVAGRDADGEQPVGAEAGAAAAVDTDVAQAPQELPSAEALKALWMTREEAASMLEVMRKDMVYLEYGSGGSTLAFAPMAKRAYSIEHDREWCLRMQEKLSIKGLSQRVTYTCAPVDRGTGGWGVSHAFEEGTYRVFKAYVDAVTALNESVFDVVLIDGRARVACALKVLPYLNDDSLVLLHDARREKYAPILNYYDPLGEVVGTYGVRLFRRKRGIEAQLPLPDDAIHAAYDDEGGKAQTAAAAT